MSDLFEGLLGRLVNIIEWIFGKNYTPSHTMVFKGDTYDPIKGAVVRGFADNPGINLTSYYPPPPPGIEFLTGDLKTHIVGSPLYQEAYIQRKMKQFNAPLIPFMQIERQRGQPRRERKLVFANGDYISSRDQKNTLSHTPRQSSMWDTWNLVKL
jgi:hypothetical protein